MPVSGFDKAMFGFRDHLAERVIHCTLRQGVKNAPEIQRAFQKIRSRHYQLSSNTNLK